MAYDSLNKKLYVDYTKTPNIGISLLEISRCLHDFRRDTNGNINLSLLCTSKNINPWTRRPLPYPSTLMTEPYVGDLTDEIRREVNHGFIIKEYTKDTLPLSQEARIWQFAYPRGGDYNEWFRASDFENYCQLAEPPKTIIHPPYDEPLDDGSYFLIKPRVRLNIEHYTNYNTGSVPFSELRTTWGNSPISPQGDYFHNWYIVLLFTDANATKDRTLLLDNVANPHVLYTGYQMRDSDFGRDSIELELPSSFTLNSKWDMLVVLADNVNGLTPGVVTPIGSYSARFVTLNLTDKSECIEQTYTIKETIPFDSLIKNFYVPNIANLDKDSNEDNWRIRDIVFRCSKYYMETQRFKIEAYAYNPMNGGTTELFGTSYLQGTWKREGSGYIIDWGTISTGGSSTIFPPSDPTVRGSVYIKVGAQLTVGVEAYTMSEGTYYISDPALHD